LILIVLIHILICIVLIVLSFHTVFIYIFVQGYLPLSLYRCSIILVHVICLTFVSRHVYFDTKIQFNSILHCFLSRDPLILIRAFNVYVRLIVEYCSLVWSPTAVGQINKIESVQMWFTKQIKSLFNLTYDDRLINPLTATVAKTQHQLGFVLRYSASSHNDGVDCIIMRHSK